MLVDKASDSDMFNICKFSDHVKSPIIKFPIGPHVTGQWLSKLAPSGTYLLLS